jgi:hypothetical protein
VTLVPTRRAFVAGTAALIGLPGRVAAADADVAVVGAGRGRDCGRPPASASGEERTRAGGAWTGRRAGLHQRGGRPALRGWRGTHSLGRPKPLATHCVGSRDRDVGRVGQLRPCRLFRRQTRPGGRAEPPPPRFRRLGRSHRGLNASRPIGRGSGRTRALHPGGRDRPHPADPGRGARPGLGGRLLFSLEGRRPRGAKRLRAPGGAARRRTAGPARHACLGDRLEWRRRRA